MIQISPPRRPSRPAARTAGVRLPAAAFAALLAVLLAGGPAAAQSDIYWVRDVAAKGEGKTDRAARTDAALNAAPAALERLLHRLTSIRDREFLPPVPPERAREMVRGLEVVRAKRQDSPAGRSFDGALSYLFNPEAVGAFLKAEQLGWSARRSDPVLVLAVWRGEGGAVLWDDPNPWRDAWAATEREPGLVPVVLPEGSLKDLQAIDAEQAAGRDAQSLAAIARAYGAKQVLVAVAAAGTATGAATGTEAEAEAEAGTEAEAEGGLTVSAALFNLRSGVSEELEPVTAKGETAMAMAEAAAVLTGRLQERWKDRVIVPEGPVSTTRVVLRFGDLAAWVRVRENLAAAPSVTGHRVIAFSAGEAQLALTHRGDADALAARLPAFGLALQQESSGRGRKAKTFWVLGERQRESEPSE
ncbi:MAG: DUF2066 domain-containing protein [Rhodospirillaceae bacterium]|nr:DUF2066 domain-containing protein [Rhodospirillaceae bacterium]MYB12045.1 DUF2066 domain-containing protein [Rhodospirillaceae bacterium]MYI50643.1 DUF2066 domain-containing protein [Rhodospirillaceae bacterium]